jgi:hypothetical protein
MAAAGGAGAATHHGLPSTGSAGAAETAGAGAAVIGSLQTGQKSGSVEELSNDTG